MANRHRTLASLLVVGVLLVAGCGDDDDVSGDAPTDTDASETGSTDADDLYNGPGGGGDDTDDGDGAGDLVVEGFEYQLQPVTSGDDVTFTNNDSAPHTLTADDDTFDTGSVGGGDSTTFTAPAAGEYAVFCTIHPDITGTLVVEE